MDAKLHVAFDSLSSTVHTFLDRSLIFQFYPISRISANNHGRYRPRSAIAATDERREDQTTQWRRHVAYSGRAQAEHTAGPSECRIALFEPSLTRDF